MITSVAGPVQAIAGDSIVVTVGGFGIRLLCPAAVVAAHRVGERAELSASLVVREDSLTLYGFVDEDQRRVFDLLQSVTGFGPKIALAVLSAMTTDELRAAVATGNERALTAISGIGRKGAQRLLLELSDKLGAPSGQSPVDVREQATSGLAASWSTHWCDPVREALLGLGWSPRDADAAIQRVLDDEGSTAVNPGAMPSEPGNQADTTSRFVAARLKQALRSLDRS